MDIAENHNASKNNNHDSNNYDFWWNPPCTLFLCSIRIQDSGPPYLYLLDNKLALKDNDNNTKAP